VIADTCVRSLVSDHFGRDEKGTRGPRSRREPCCLDQPRPPACTRAITQSVGRGFHAVYSVLSCSIAATSACDTRDRARVLAGLHRMARRIAGPTSRRRSASQSRSLDLAGGRCVQVRGDLQRSCPQVIAFVTVAVNRCKRGCQRLHTRSRFDDRGSDRPGRSGSTAVMARLCSLVSTTCKVIRSVCTSMRARSHAADDKTTRECERGDRLEKAGLIDPSIPPVTRIDHDL
jgi:hypothetical protein